MRKIYIYIDSKIEGCVKQLCDYFESGVFNKKNILVYYKKYKSSNIYFEKNFSKHNINSIAFSKFSEILLEPGGVVYYLFNSQSNARIVANRNLKHVFVTHGESNKVASTKPIIRIYDFIVTSGEAGIDRYRSSGIFTNSELSTGRHIKMGDTFIGRNCFLKQLEHNYKRAAYTPTWEGGVVNENYSSLSDDNNFSNILKILKNNNIQNIIIKPHPNLGHRSKIMIEKLIDGINFLTTNDIEVCLISDSSNFRRWWHKFLKPNYNLVSENNTYFINFAICDVSAMETQFLANNINTFVYVPSQKDLLVNRNVYDEYYEPYCTGKSGSFLRLLSKKQEELKNLLLSFSFHKISELPLDQRVNSLSELVYKCPLN